MNMRHLKKAVAVSLAALAAAGMIAGCGGEESIGAVITAGSADGEN
jgi:hypothetical protein